MVIGGLITLGLGKAATEDWRLLVYIIAIPAIVYLIMLARAKFPVSERVSMGATYAEMLGEFGVIGAALAPVLDLPKPRRNFSLAILCGLHPHHCWFRSIWRVLQVARSSDDDLLVLDHDASRNHRVGNRRSHHRYYGRADERSRIQPSMGFDLHLGDHDGIAILCWSNRQSLDAARFVGSLLGARDCWPLQLVCSQRHGIDLCSSDALRCGQDILLANHVGCCGRAIPKGGAFDA